MALKFRRNYRLLVDTINANLIGPQLPGAATQTRSIEILPPFSIDFAVMRQNLGVVNTASITVTGLGLNTRTLIRKDVWETDVYRPIELWAGYGTGKPSPIELINSPNATNTARQLFPRIFRGNVTRAYSYRPGVEWLTKLECQDAGFASVNGDVNLSYNAGTPILQVIEELIGHMPTISIGAIGSFPGVLARGETFIGNPKDRLLELTGGNFFIDNEKGYCLNPDEYIVNAAVPIITDANGIMGVPIKETTLVHINLLFEPGITIGQKISLKTSTVPYYNGDYIVKGLGHKGVISQSVCGSVTTSLILDNLDPNARLVSQR